MPDAPRLDYFSEWICVFPGKMGLSWKHAHPYGVYGSKADAEVQAAKNCNVVAVPRQLFDRMKEHERRMVKAEPELAKVRRGVRPASRGGKGRAAVRLPLDVRSAGGRRRGRCVSH